MNTEVTTKHIWELLSSRLRSFLRARVSNEQVAEDLLQDTFIRIHRKIDFINDEERLTSWVFQIARNLVIDHYRSQARGAVAKASDIEIESDEVEESNLNDLVSSWLPEMIDQLPDGYREAVELYELKGVSQKEIADRLGVSLSGAKSRIQRGRKKLKAMLLDCCSFEYDRRGNVIDFAQNGDENCGCDDPCNS